MREVVCWLALLGLIGGVALPGETAAPTDYRFQAPLSDALQPDTPVRVPLPREVLVEAQPGLADIRLFDDQGGETPYVMYPARVATPSTVVLSVLTYGQDQDSERIVLQRPSGVGPVHELALRTSAKDFHKTVRIEASEDQVTWREVATDVVFDFSSRIDVRKTTLTLPATDAPYFRLLLKDVSPPRPEAPGMQLRYEGLELVTRGQKAQPFRLEQIQGRVGLPQGTDELYDHVTIADPVLRTTTPGQTLVLLGRLNVPMAQLTLVAENAYYHRRIEIWGAALDRDDAYQQVASGVVYKLPGVAASETTLRVALKAYPYMRLHIVNGDNPPLRLQSVDIAWPRHYLYFIPAAGRRYTLYVGNPASRAPVYELQNLLPAHQAGLAQYAVAPLGVLQAQSHYKPATGWGAPGQVGTVLLTTLLLVVTVGLAWWAYRLLKVVTKR